MKRFIVLCFLFSHLLNIMAYDFSSNGIYYKITSETALTVESQEVATITI